MKSRDLRKSPLQRLSICRAVAPIEKKIPIKNRRKTNWESFKSEKDLSCYYCLKQFQGCIRRDEIDVIERTAPEVIDKFLAIEKTTNSLPR
uniref:Uncharacterized protein n=1 Tax=Megaselia scalaris TaxID=36166 RepID=T1GX63_MEGSC